MVDAGAVVDVVVDVVDVVDVDDVVVVESCVLGPLPGLSVVVVVVVESASDG